MYINILELCTNEISESVISEALIEYLRLNIHYYHLFVRG